MNADYVENIIRNIDKQSYKCILVDGAWGIGKSYMVRKALEDMKDRTCFISLFGMDRKEAFPIDNITQTKMSICYNVLTVLYLHDKEKLENLYHDLKPSFSKMGVRRTDDLLKEIREDN